MGGKRFWIWFYELLLLSFVFGLNQWLPWTLSIVILKCYRINIYNGQRRGRGGQEGNFLSKPFPPLQPFHLFPKEMSSSKLWINFSISRELETFFAFHCTHQLYKLNLVLQNLAQTLPFPGFLKGDKIVENGDLRLLSTFCCEIIPFWDIFLFSAASNPVGSTFLARALIPIGNFHQS